MDKSKTVTQEILSRSREANGESVQSFESVEAHGPNYQAFNGKVDIID